MNSRRFRFGIMMTFCFLLASNSSSLVLLDGDMDDNHKKKLVNDLERATGLWLEIRKDFIREMPNSFRGMPLFSNGQKTSLTGRFLLQGALQTDTVYRVRTAQNARLGRSGSGIDLNFSQLKRVRLRGVPPQAFGAGIILLHELAHIHRGLLDPNLAESKSNPDVKGQTVEFINVIQRELGLPERLHYFPKKLTGRDDIYCIYFGEVERVEISAKILRAEAS